MYLYTGALKASTQPVYTLPGSKRVAPWITSLMTIWCAEIKTPKLEFTTQMANSKNGKIGSLKDLENLRKAAQTLLALRCPSTTGDEDQAAPSPDQKYPEGQFDVALCMGTSCISSGAQDVRDALLEELDKFQIS